MALQTTININVDFYDKKYKLINAKQYDRKSRFLLITCYNHGEVYPINAGEHSAYVRYKKADNYGVFNFCEINRHGKILVELTEQMLASDGICYADLVIVNKGSANVDVDTGEIIAIDNSAILSTMTFCIDVSETAVENSEIESSYEYNGLNTALEKAEAEYTEVIQLSKSYAVGNAGGIRENEDYDNSKYYYEQTLKSANNAKTSEANALTSEKNAKTSEENASASEANSKTSEQNAKASEENAKISETNSSNSELSARQSMDEAKDSADNAYDYAIMSQRYAVGGTNSVSYEDVDNAKYYYEQAKGVSDSVSGKLSPQGTVAFEELVTVDKFTGYLYVVEDSFTTDDTFADGAGIEYPAGTIVYYTVNGFWACFDGLKTDVATVDEVVSYLGI